MFEPGEAWESLRSVIDDLSDTDVDAVTQSVLGCSGLDVYAIGLAPAPDGAEGEDLPDPYLQESAVPGNTPMTERELAAWLAGSRPLTPAQRPPAFTAPSVVGLSTALTREPGPELAVALATLLAPPTGDTVLDPRLSDAEVVTYVAAAEGLSRWAQWLRSQAIRDLQDRWVASDPRTDLRADEGEDVERSRRLRRAARGHEQRSRFQGLHPHREYLGGPLRPPRAGDPNPGVERAELAAAFVVAETALAAGVSANTGKEWARVAAALVPDWLPVTDQGLRTGRLDWAKARTIVDTLCERDPHVAGQVEAMVVPDALTGPGQRIRTVPALKERLATALLLLDPDGGDGPRERAARTVITRQLSPHLGELVARMPIEDLAIIAARLDTAAAQARRDRDPRTADQVRLDTLVDLLTPHTTTGGVSPDQTTEPAHPSAAPAGDPSAAGESSEAGDETEPDPTGEPAADSTPPPAQARNRTGCSCDGTSVQILLIMTLETLLGLTDDPALLDRYGPVPAALARDLAVNATFRCAAVDDTHGTILGLGHGTYRDSYRPGPHLVDLTRATYRRCSFPGCRTRALTPTGNADLDHAQPYPHGPTCSCNLHALCRPHHRLKTHGRIVLEAATGPDHPPGSWHWRLPTGHTHTAHPEPALTHLRQPLADDDQLPPF